MSLGLIYKNQETILEERETYGVPYLVYPLLEETGIVTHAFSTRLGGVSKGPWATMNLSGTRGTTRRQWRRISGGWPES